MVWHIFRRTRYNVAYKMFFNSKISLVGFLAPIIPFAREDTASANGLKTQTDAAYPGK